MSNDRHVAALVSRFVNVPAVLVMNKRDLVEGDVLASEGCLPCARAIWTMRF